MPSTKRSAAKDAPTRSRSLKAYQAGAPARAALSSAELVHVNVDIPAAVATVRGTIPRLLRFQRSVAMDMPAFSESGLAQLQASTDALAFAQAAYLSIEEGDDPVPALVAQATTLLQLLLGAARPLADRDLIDPKRLTRLNVSSGYLKTAMTLGALARLLRDRWPAIASKTAIRAEELDEAERLAREIPRACADRGAGSVAVKAAAEERQRAYTLFHRAYDEVRRSVVYLRWHEGDADTIAPSLFAGRGGRGKTAKSSASRESQASSKRVLSRAAAALETSGVDAMDLAAALGRPIALPSRRAARR